MHCARFRLANVQLQLARNAQGRTCGVRGVSSLGALAAEPLLAVPEGQFEAYIPPITAHYSGQGFEPYQWHVADGDAPRAPKPLKPLSECRLGVLSTSGAYISGEHLAYCYKDDTTVRHIRNDAELGALRFSHITENYLVAGRSDPNCLLPLDALRQLVSEQVLGDIAPSVLSCMGGIYSVRRVQEELVPAILSAFREQQADGVLLVPM